MKHYVCLGECGGESKKPGVCQAEDCSRSKEALVECDCTDGSHEEVLFGESEGDALIEPDDES